VFFVAKVVILGKSGGRLLMKSDRIWSALTGVGPLALCIVYLWNPWGRRELVFDAALIVLALWALWQNPFRGKPRSALFFGVEYAAAAIAAIVAFIYRHHTASALWIGLFLAFACGWFYRYRHDVSAAGHALAVHEKANLSG
jgi:hypothetical protein